MGAFDPSTCSKESIPSNQDTLKDTFLYDMAAYTTGNGHLDARHLGQELDFDGVGILKVMVTTNEENPVLRSKEEFSL